MSPPSLTAAASFDGSNAKKTASFILPSAVAVVNITAGVEFIRAQRVVDRTFSWSGKADSALHTANIGPALTAVGGVLAVTDGVWNIVSSVILARKTHKSGFNERTIIGGVKIGGGNPAIDLSGGDGGCSVSPRGRIDTVRRGGHLPVSS